MTNIKPEGKGMKLMKPFLITIFIFALFMGGCASGQKPPKIAKLDYSMIMTPVGTSNVSPEEISTILEKVEKRNKTVEDEKDWIKKSYKGLRVRRLTNVSSSQFAGYRKFLDDGAAYIIVHPAFFTFFHYPTKLRKEGKDNGGKMNIVDILLNRNPRYSQEAVLQAQERRMRDFIEFKSTQNKLLILVVPRKYWKYSGYTYRKSRDEYMRFLNEVTNMSHSVLFVESRDPNRGYLTDDDAVKLMEFLMSIDAEKIYVGGGYIGRCLEDFYTLLTKDYGTEGIFVVPELSDISPRELNADRATQLLKPDGFINQTIATQMLTEDTYKVQELIPQLESLH